MYSVVLLAAMSTGGSAAPAWCHGCNGGCFGCHGCYGCFGYSGCYGYGGCYGGSYGYAGFGCYGSCYGCYGCSGCFGCSGCYGCSGCFGCSGCYGGYGGGYFVPGGGQIMAPATGGAFLSANGTAQVVTASAQSARVTVELPADAKLFVDDQEMKTTSAKRVFRTPNLEPGQTYYYILRAELTRDGKTLSQTKRILVRAGTEVPASLNELTAQNTAQVGTKDEPIAAR